MPQLMPLMWLGSVFVFMLIFMMLTDLYFYMIKINKFSMKLWNENKMINYKW